MKRGTKEETLVSTTTPVSFATPWNQLEGEFYLVLGCLF